MNKTEEIKQMNNLKDYCLSENLDKENTENRAVFFGTGLASTQAPSLGFGVDILSTILTSLKVKRILGAKEVLHLISTTGYNVSEDTRENIIKKQKDIMEKIIQNLGIGSEYRLVLSSEFINSQQFLKIKKDVEKKLSIFDDTINFDKYGSYTILQTAISKYLYEKEGAILKTGWCVRNTERPAVVSEEYAKELIEGGHLNEIFFDEMYRYAYPEDDYSFVYTPPAIGLNGRCSPPYTVTEMDSRPLIDDDLYKYYNNYTNSMSDKKDKKDKRKKLKKSLENWERTIINPYEELFEKLEVSKDSSIPEYTILKKVSLIQEKVLEDRKISINGKNIVLSGHENVKGGR